MKRTIIFLLVFFFILNSTSLYLILEIHRHRISASLEKNVVTEKVEIITVNRKDLSGSLIRLDKKEISFHGKLYDVIIETQEKDHIHFYCIRDTKEENIMAGMHKTGGNKLVTLLLNDFVKITHSGRAIADTPAFFSEVKFPELKDTFLSIHPSADSPPPKTA